MESTSVENVEIDEKIEQTDDVENSETSNVRQERQDYSSENNKIEISNMGKFVHGVSI